MQRWVLHIDMDAFFASVEQLTRPTLRGRPVLVGGLAGRGVVAGASYEARKFGARSAMPMFQARALIGPRATTVRPRFPVYSAASKRVFEIVRAQAGLVEQLSIDEAFLEPSVLQGADPEKVGQWCQQLRESIRRETGLPASLGAGPGKQAAKIGSGLAKPDGVFVIPVTDQVRLLHPLPVRQLWGIGPISEQKLKRLGIDTIGDFAALEQKEVEAALGKTVGPALWQIAQGNDDRSVAPRAEAKQVSAEHTYPKDLTTKAEVDEAVSRSMTDAYRRLKKDGRAARTISVKLKLADFTTETRSLTLSYASDDLETLTAATRRLTRYPEQIGPIRLVGVSLSGLELERQDVMFPELDQQVTVTEDVAGDFETGVRSSSHSEVISLVNSPQLEESRSGTWYSTQDVFHPEYGHGWVQGCGHGVVTVRFETRSTAHGRTKSFADDDPLLTEADPLASLDWDDWLSENYER
ncbi:DNA polymerase IV [Corynebacterium epidermidicanis]|uniref:DNA polymerase IV n=1 Tax=Corynebacterium epidermidicanis TaxID=1050174 RepID=A0A0G3GXA8_9CORY|nr:DNA polymerase IV [Corynebacterium epidermidicanis]AKK03507.1 DNA polymerase IV [Corynebacterium epidermidicanis]